MVLLILGGKFLLIRSHASDVPHWDSWIVEGDLLLKPWVEGDLEISSLIGQHNEHRPALTRAWALAIFIVNGQWDARLEAVANAFLHLASALILFHLLGPLFRGWMKPALLLLLVLIFALPFDWENTLRGFQSQFAFLLLFTLIHLHGSLMRKPLGVGWWVAQAAGFATLLSAGSGFVSAAVVIVILGYRALLLRQGSRGDIATLIASVAILGAGFLLSVPAPWHDQYHPDSVLTFLHSLTLLLAWPFPLFLVAPLMVAPILILALKTPRSPPSPASPVLIVLALGLWTWIQTAGLAYSRGGFFLGYSSRYGDLLAVGVIASAAALAVLLSNRPFRGWLRALPALAVCWAALSITGVVYRSFWGERQNLRDLKRIHPIQISLIRDFIVNGDPEALRDQPFLHIPFPDADTLARLLSDPTIRSILPVSIRPTIPLEPDPYSTHGFIPEGVPPETHAQPLEPSWGSFTELKARQQGYFRSAPIHSDLPLLSLTIAGTFSLDQENLTLISIDSNQIIEPMISRTPGVRFMTMNTFRPSGRFAFSVSDQDAETWIAVSNPAEMGLFSWLANKFSKLGLELMVIGSILVLVPTGLNLLQKYRAPDLEK